MATVFLFGAGASYGSDTASTPPLGAGLFKELRQFNPDAWGTITGDLVEQFSADFEEALQAVAPHALAPLQRAMAAYFFEFRPRPGNLYVQLARRIARTQWSGSVCTLNYERLLELPLLQAGIQPFVGDAPLGARKLELCFPHGCCHIFCDAVRGMASGISFHGFGIQTDGPVTIIADPKEHRTRILQDAFPPVMSYFEPAKRTTAGASFIQGQRDRWQQLASSAATLIIVGVRVRPHDDHIWGPIAPSSARVVYCAGSSGSPEYKAWASAARPGRNDLVLQGTFRDEFNRICSEAGL